MLLPDIRYPASQISGRISGKFNRISGRIPDIKKAGYPAGRISSATLVFFFKDFDESFYRGFHLVVCGLDSIVARRWINGMLLSMLEYDDDGELDRSTLIPIIEGGTEGFKGTDTTLVLLK